MPDSSTATILFTDLVGSTELASELGDIAVDVLRRDHFTSLREAIAATGGQEVKTIGDAMMVAYGPRRTGSRAPWRCSRPSLGTIAGSGAGGLLCGSA